MSKNPLFLLLLGLAVISFTSAASLAQTIEVRLAGGSDDAEQHLNAGMDVGSSDLEMPYEDGGDPGTDEQLTCLRFLVPLEAGVKVTNAYVEFTCDETKGGSNPVNLIIEGQLALNPPTFTTAANNLTGRAPWTTAQVAWTVENWTTTGQKSKTANIAAVIQEIINQSGWTSGDALVLAFRDDKSKPSTGIRCADAYEDGADLAARLYIEISKAPAALPSPAAGAADVPWDAILSWKAGAGATAHDVYFGTVQADVDSASQADAKGVLVSRGQADTQYDPAGNFEYGQTYYWRVDEVAGSTVTQGQTWSFTVEPFAYPITGITATASSAQAGMGPENTINGSGLNANDEHSAELTEMWTSAGTQPNWIQYEFDKVYKLHELLVWNSNQLIEAFLGFGAKDVTLEHSVDGQTWTQLDGVPEFARATASVDYKANTTVDLAGVMAKFVKLTINSNWGGLAPQTGLAEVRFFFVPVRARLPQPASGATDVSIDTDLSWRVGREAESHEVYLGADPNALTLAGTVAEASYSPSALGLDMMYYWKVNELGGAGPYEGEVWNFKTSNKVVVEDFEAYNDDEDSRIYVTWVDGYEDPKNGGSQVGHLESPFAETKIVHGGRQAMPLFYSNTNGATFSDAVRTFAAPQDWTRAGINTLTVWFHGADGNAGQMYLKINGTKIAYSGTGSLSLAGWQLWNINLASLNVSLKSVRTLAIGVEGAAATGTLYFDDIALYAVAPEPLTDWRVAASTDDGEEYADSGTMVAANSSDLELGHEGAVTATSLQIVGCRWTGIAIPKGATITEAWVQFSADAVSDAFHAPAVSLIIEGELAPSPLTFSTLAKDISGRPKTTKSVVWDVPVWTTVHAKGPEERTPDISAIIQEIVNQAGWNGQALVLTFRDNPAKPSQGTREAESYDGGADEAPLLHIRYQ